MTQIQQQELARRFARGDHTDDLPRASNVEAIAADDDSDDDAHLIGYGWAIYATRSENGDITMYDGWRGYSMSTTCQMTELRKGFRTALDTAYDRFVTTDDDARPSR